MKCPLCGYTFDENKTLCGGCLLNKNCKLICCPHCHYQIPLESEMLKIFKKIWRDVKGFIISPSLLTFPAMRKGGVVTPTPLKGESEKGEADPLGNPDKKWKAIANMGRGGEEMTDPEKNLRETGENRESSLTEKMDEVLELIWTSREEGRDELEEIAEESAGQVTSDILGRLARDGFLEIRDGKILLTRNGEKKAATIIRRHRLAETLLSEVFDLEHRHVESHACKFEHILGATVTESVCTFLGHPRNCPHGKPIPPGSCCSKFQLEVKPLVQKLSDFKPGEMGKIIFITPKQRSRLDRLSSLGIIPGTIIKLQQKQPSFVLEIGNTLVALDSEIVKEIYIKPVN